MPTLVKEELTTVEFNVVPVRVPAGAMTTLELAAVINPFPFTVNEGIEVDDPKDPTVAFTVASVVKPVLLMPMSPDKDTPVAIPEPLPTKIFADGSTLLKPFVI